MGYARTKKIPRSLVAGMKGFAVKSWIWFAVFGGWSLIVHLFGIRAIILPSVTDVVKRFILLGPVLFESTCISLYMIVIGFIAGTVLGIGMSLFMAYSRFFRESFISIFDFLRAVPVFALIPLFLVWFGIGRAPQIALITVGVSVVISVTTFEAIRNMSRIHIMAAQALGANKKQIYTTVILPAISPHLIGAIRVGAAASFGLDAAAEFMGSQVGLGYLMIMQSLYLRTDGILAIVIIYCVLAYVADRIVCVVEKKLTYWTERRV